MVVELPDDPQHHDNVRTFVSAGPEDRQASLELVFRLDDGGGWLQRTTDLLHLD
jgi:hypothetical protein